ncbi:ferrous iron transport protein B [Puniceicoccus vermicola]|uniref:ferrous iron transport protein B n=1 Tax=Puniceicoccus vermicola TaxID=388746 RepID=UPI0033972885
MVLAAEKKKTARVGLIGNPNTGKSTLFNRLTGLRQRIANYPGITVEERVGTAFAGNDPLELVDLPGAYSLSATTADERAVLDALAARSGRDELDLLICVIDPTNLERNLFLPLQAADFGLPMILVLNQWDIARKRGLNIDCDKLAERFGVPVVPISARSGEGMAKLEETIRKKLEVPSYIKPTDWNLEVEQTLNQLCETVSGLRRAEALRFLFDPRSALYGRWPDQREEIGQIVEEGRRKIAAAGLNPGPAEALIQYGRIREILADVSNQKERRAVGASESIDRLLLHRFWGSIIFVAVMWVVFQSVYSWAGPIMDGLDFLTGATQEALRPVLSGTPLLESLVVDGIVAGVGGVIIFLPQIFVLFFFIGLLEDTGYMARAAFLMDKALGWCGLNGKSFVPLLSSYACAIPGIMAARTLESRWSRTTTILMAPFMSCSARLPVYVLFIGAFVEPTYGAAAAGWTLFLLHFVGLFIAASLAWVAHRFFAPSGASPFILEMPHYKVPHLRNLLLRMWESGREFLMRAGSVILAFSVLIWALLYFPRSESVETEIHAQSVERITQALSVTSAKADELLADQESPYFAEYDNLLAAAYLENSYLGRFGQWVQPVFAPAGFDWKITVGVLSSFPARELVISTLGIIYQLGPDVDEESSGLRDQIANETWPSGPKAGMPVFTLPVVFSVLIFFCLCLQCGATVALIAKELNGWYAAGSFFGMTALAWVAAVLVYQVGTLL